MSNANYDLRQKGVRLISADEAWTKAKETLAIEENPNKKTAIKGRRGFLHLFGKMRNCLVKKNFLILDLREKAKRKLRSTTKISNKKRTQPPSCAATRNCLLGLVEF